MDTTEQGTAAPGATGRRGEGFFAWVRSLGMRRTDDRWLSGSCAAVARRAGIDPAVVRTGAVVLALMGGVGLVAYAALWLLLPEGPGGGDDRSLAERARDGDVQPAAVAAAGVAALGVTVPPVWRWWWPGADVGPGLWRAGGVLAVVVAVGLVLGRHGADERADGGCGAARARPHRVPAALPSPARPRSGPTGAGSRRHRRLRAGPAPRRRRARPGGEGRGGRPAPRRPRR